MRDEIDENETGLLMAMFILLVDDDREDLEIYKQLFESKRSLIMASTVHPAAKPDHP